jgi:hypothetical protein
MTGLRASVFQEMAQLSPVCSGSLHEQYLTCGKPECRCHDRKQSQRHGPYYLWVRHIGGKQVNRTLKPGPALDRVREGITNYQRVQQLFSKWLQEEEGRVLEPERAVENVGKKNFRKRLRRR